MDPADSAARAPDGEHATRGHYVVKTDLRKTNDDALNHVFDSLGLQETLNALAILGEMETRPQFASAC